MMIAKMTPESTLTFSENCFINLTSSVCCKYIYQSEVIISNQWGAKLANLVNKWLMFGKQTGNNPDATYGGLLGTIVRCLRWGDSSILVR